jgi:cysteine desulfurase
MSLSSHKIYGPKGVGALYIRKGTPITPLIHGGHHERRRRAGTENLPGIVGLGVACELARENLPLVQKRLTQLRDLLQNGISSRLEHVLLNGHPAFRLPHTLNLSFLYVEGEALVMSLDLKGVAVSTGSACTSDSLEPSHVLMAMGRTPEQAHGSVRFSLGLENTEDDINYVIEMVVECVNRLREVSRLGTS